MYSDAMLAASSSESITGLCCSPQKKKKLDESHKASSEKIDSIKKQREQKVRMSAPRIGC
jgi:hypothetical protein